MLSLGRANFCQVVTDICLSDSLTIDYGVKFYRKLILTHYSHSVIRKVCRQFAL